VIEACHTHKTTHSHTNVTHTQNVTQNVTSRLARKAKTQMFCMARRSDKKRHAQFKRCRLIIICKTEMGCVGVHTVFVSGEETTDSVR
jgi:hypothetical protein